MDGLDFQHLNDAHVWVAVGVVVFIAMLWKPVSRFATKALDARSAKVRTELNEAARLVAEADALLKKYQDFQAQAKKEADDLLKQARNESEHIRKRAMEEVEIALEAREKHAMDRIRQAESAALQQVRQTTVNLAMSAARKIISDTLDDNAAEHLMTESLSHIGRKPN